MRGSETVDGQPVKVYDNGGETFDRYTVVYMKVEADGANFRREYGNKAHAARGMSVSPFSPQGFGMYVDAVPGPHLGKRIPFASLPNDCQTAVHNDLRPEEENAE